MAEFGDFGPGGFGPLPSAPAPLVSQEQLRDFYARVFPSATFCRWLCPDPNQAAAGGSSVTSNSAPSAKPMTLRNREFSFTLHGDVYCRYLSYNDAASLKDALVTRVPEKIDIGAVFNECPRDQRAMGVVAGSAFYPVERELVFDIDMDEYDDIRQCCKGASVCKKCWTFIASAARIIEASMRTDFGFEHMMFVFSGRRGIHCWVCDQTARQLTNDQRSAIAEYMQILTSSVSGSGGSGGLRASSVLSRFNAKQYPLIKRSIATCLEYVEKAETGVLDGQRCFSADASEEGILSRLLVQGGATPGTQAHDMITAPLRSKHGGGSRNSDWNRNSDGTKNSDGTRNSESQGSVGIDRDIWRRIVAFSPSSVVHQICGGGESSSGQRRSSHQPGVELDADAVVMELAYPRIDINVSKHRNHLLKAPFCVHPKTGNICVPVADVDSFDPGSTPPKLKDVLADKSLMDPFIKFFDVFVTELRNAEIAVDGVASVTNGYDANSKGLSGRNIQVSGTLVDQVMSG